MLHFFRRKAEAATEALPEDSAPDRQGSPLAGEIAEAAPSTLPATEPASGANDQLSAADFPQLSIHPLAAAFPAIEGQAFDVLMQSIKEQGQIEPITVWRGQILDGRNRYRACQKLGVVPMLVEFACDDPQALVQFVTAKNMARRHLNEAQRAMAAARLAEWHGIRLNDAARQLAISPASARRAKRVLANGGENIVQLVTRGEMAVYAAYEMTAKRKRPKKSAADRDLARGMDLIERALAAGEPFSVELCRRAQSIIAMLSKLPSTKTAVA